MFFSELISNATNVMQQNRSLVEVVADFRLLFVIKLALL